LIIFCAEKLHSTEANVAEMVDTKLINLN
jgi:hypothetical protein